MIGVRLIHFITNSRISMVLLLNIINVLLSSALLFTISTVSYRATADYISEETKRINSSNLEQAKRKLENRISHVRNITAGLVNNDVLLQSIRQFSQTDDVFLRILYEEDINNIILKSKGFSKEIRYTEVVAGNRVFLSSDIPSSDLQKLPVSSEAFRATPMYSKLLAAPKSTVLITGGDPQFASGFPDDQLVFGSLLSQGDTELGFVLVGLNKDWMSDLLSNQPSMLVVNERNELLWTNDRATADTLGSMFETAQMDQESGSFTVHAANVYYTTMDSLKWKICYVDNQRSLATEVRNMRNFSIFAFLVSLLINIWLSRTLSRRVSIPIVHILDRIQKYNSFDDYELFEMQRKNRFSFKSSIVLSMMLCAMIPAMIYVGLFYVRANDIVLQKTMDGYNNTMESATENIETLINDKLDMFRRLSFDESLQETIYNVQHRKDQSGETVNKLRSVVYNNFPVGDPIMEVSILDDRYNILYTNLDRNEQALGKNIVDQLKWEYHQNIVRDMSGSVNEKLVANLLLKITGLHPNRGLLTTIGYIRHRFDLTNVEEIYKRNIKNNDHTFIINDLGNYVLHSNRGEIGERMPGFDRAWLDSGSVQWNGNRYEMTEIRLSVDIGERWYLLYSINNSELIYINRNVLLKNIYILIICFLVIVIISNQLSNRLTSSLSRIVSRLYDIQIKQDAQGMEGIRRKLLYKRRYGRIREMEELGLAFNEMAQKIETLVDDLLISNLAKKQMARAKDETEVIALQAQINPHFLYNTLELINRVIKDGQSDKAIRMINALSDLFRYGINNNDVLIPLSEELKYSRAYIEILRVQFGGNIEFVWHVDVKVSQYKIIKLVLQPMIENATRHGLIHKQTGGIVLIKIHVVRHKLIIRVYDNGVGIARPALREINAKLRNNSGGSTGIYNVNRRIKLYFGEESGLLLHSCSGKGTVANLCICRPE